MRGGARPGAGRKKEAEDKKIKLLKGMCVDWAIRVMRSKRGKESIKREVALKVLGRAIPQEQTLMHKGDLTVQIVKYKK